MNQLTARHFYHDLIPQRVHDSRSTQISPRPVLQVAELALSTAAERQHVAVGSRNERVAFYCGDAHDAPHVRRHERARLHRRGRGPSFRAAQLTIFRRPPEVHLVRFVSSHSWESTRR